ncbi:MAG: SPOR domain-containing protein [Thermoplasmata archaeon]|nr:SPOR domain-containing protein [Thermoplasmata archaeon]
MQMLKALLIVGLTILLLIGCSEKQKEASRLEQEVRDQEESAMTDKGLQDSGMAVDTSSAPSSADASAIPPEAQPGITTQPMPPAPTGEGWTVQVASCESQTYARHLVDVFTSRGYQPYVTTITQGEQLYYRVRIGSLTNLAEARSLKDELTDRYSVKAWIDKIER